MNERFRFDDGALSAWTTVGAAVSGAADGSSADADRSRHALDATRTMWIHLLRIMTTSFLTPLRAGPRPPQKGRTENHKLRQTPCPRLFSAPPNKKTLTRIGPIPLLPPIIVNILGTSFGIQT
jgi:hypothetical protein